jgi:hypothetical protein
MSTRPIHVVVTLENPFETHATPSAIGAEVELRNHPSMSFQGRHSWPPVWLCIAGEPDTSPEGEIGLLQAVRLASRTPSLADRCFLIVEHEDAIYIGCVLFDDEFFCQQLFARLKKHIGQPLQHIGGLKFSRLDF